MLYVDIPTRSEFATLSTARADACVSIYLKTTPVTQDVGASRIEFGNLIREAQSQLQDARFDKRLLAALFDSLSDLLDDDEFWRFQANSLAVFVTADSIRAYRLANDLTSMVQVSDRFHLKPLLRAVTFPHSAFILALSENAVRFVEMHADLAPEVVKVPDMPKDAASSAGKSTLNDRTFSGRIHGSEGQNVRLQQYVRKVDAALRQVLSGRESPLVLAATGRLASYSVRLTKRDSGTTRGRTKPVKSGRTKQAVISRARSARKFINTTASPSRIGTASARTVGCTNSSVSPRA